MLAKIDQLIEKDGWAAKASGALALLLIGLIVGGIIPAAHADPAWAIVLMLSGFAPAAQRRAIVEAKKEAQRAPQPAE